MLKTLRKVFWFLVGVAFTLWTAVVLAIGYADGCGNDPEGGVSKIGDNVVKYFKFGKREE